MRETGAFKSWIGDFAKWITWLAVAASAASCGAGDSAPPTTSLVTEMNPDAGSDANQGQTIEYYSVLFGSGNAEVAQALFDVHKKRHPDDQIIYTPIPVLQVSRDYGERVNSGRAPDVAVWFGSELRTAFPLHPLNDLLMPNGSPTDLSAHIYPELMEEVTLDGAVYALPWTVMRENTLFYNKHVFRAHNLLPPTTIAEFLTVCQTLKKDVTPVGVSGVQYLLHAALAGVMGIDAYCNYLKGEVPDETSVGTAIDVFAEVLDNCVDPHTLQQTQEVSEDQEVDALMRNETAMYVNPDSAAAQLEQLGWTAGIDYGMLPTPGSAGLFVYRLHTLIIPAGASHLQGALRFLDSAGSLEGHLATDPIAKQTGARSDVDVSTFDSERQGFIEDMKQARHRSVLKRSATFLWPKPILAFMQSTPHDKQALLQVLLSSP